MKAKTLFAFVLALGLSAAVSAQTPTPAQLVDQAQAGIAQAESALNALKAQLTQPLPPPIVTTTDLQAAVNRGGVIDLPITMAGPLVGNFVLSVPGTVLHGNGAKLDGPAGAATIYVPPGAHDIAVSDLSSVTSNDNQRVIQVGNNDEMQTSADQAPRNITFTNVTIPTFRGKRGFEISGANVTLTNCSATDIYSVATSTPDSQAVGITSNAPGPVHIDGGSYYAGSENIMIGGSVPFTPGNVPKDILVENVVMRRPSSWITDGVDRKLKNGFEVKTGEHVTLRNSVIDVSFKGSQDGYAIVVTPHSGGQIHDVLLDHLTITNVAACLQILGQEYDTHSPVTPARTSGVVFSNSTCTASKVYDKGLLGIAAGITGAPADVTFTGNTFTVDGSRIVVYEAGNVLTADGTTTQPAGPMQSLTFTGNRVAGGMTYSFMLQGVANAGPTQQGVTTLTIANNTFADASSALKRNAPNNTYVDRATFDQLIAAGGH